MNELLAQIRRPPALKHVGPDERRGPARQASDEAGESIAALLRAKLAQRKKLLDAREEAEEATTAPDTWDTEP
eukprot:CAMPEP_0119082754 /NCGR_PEP_ID=MMETSP1178-20130426/122781_1 /TAXON_ID=33656 /ORGANISM="unid sp, Strain CCMP2000" /LENGTH=72 /DNA_ID=CAMNT_0007065555 /DNA_START=1 /DNA_END=219 /DNA_ORIENTATION=-